MERNYFYLLECSDCVVDIRCIIIANELGIQLPKNPTNAEEVVMTTDFFYNYKN